MSSLDDYRRYVADMSAASAFSQWKKQNPNEYVTWQAWDKQLQAGNAPTAPVLRTKFGAAMVDAGVLYMNAVAAPPKPPDPVPPDPVPVPPDPSPGPGGLDSRYPAALQTLYASFKPPSSPTKTVSNQAGLQGLRLSAGDDVLVKAGTYPGQYDLTGSVASGRIGARIRFEAGVKFTAGGQTIAALNLHSLAGVLLEGPADVTNSYWATVLVNDCADLIVRGLCAHGSSLSGFYQGGDEGGSRNVWFADCEAYTNGHNGPAWASYPTNYYLAGAHGFYYGGGGSQTSGGGIVGCYVHEQHVGYGIQLYGHTSGAVVSYCRFVNIDGKVSGADANLQTGSAGDRAGIGVEAWGSGVQALTIGPGNSFSNCAYKNVNVDGGAAATII